MKEHDWVYTKPVKHPPGSVSIWRGYRRRCSKCKRIEYLMGTSCGGIRFWSDWPELKDPPPWPKGGTTRQKPEVGGVSFEKYVMKTECPGRKKK